MSLFQMSVEAPPLKYGQLPPDSEQIVFVKDALDRIQGHGFLMNRGFDQSEIETALTHATTMLEDMKTSLVTPIHYNELYQTVMSFLSALALNFQDTHFFSERRVAELYETLQYTSAIVPRLYLLFTVAPAFVKAGHAKACDVMRDLIEMARGVQHPTRALFLRHFLLHIMKDVLPDEQRTEGGVLEDTLTFILENFKQMNVLWVRLEFALNTETIEERKVQRTQLRQLVGSNIQRMASLRGLDVSHYKEMVMPCVIEQIVGCREALAQYYIIESITQAFPAEFHIETLQELFQVLGNLEDEVSTLALVTGIIKRLQIHYASESADMSSAIGIVKLVAQQIDELLRAGQKVFTLEDTLDMLTTLLDFTLGADAGNAGNVDSILHFVETHIEGIYGDARLDSVLTSRKLRFFMMAPLRDMSDMSMLFELTYFPVLVNRMRYSDRKMIANTVCEGFSRTEALIDNEEKLKAFFGIVQVLLKKPTDFEEDPDGEPITVQLQEVARVFHLIRNSESLDMTFALLTTVATTIQAEVDQEVLSALCLPLGQALLRVGVEIEEAPETTTTTVRKVLQQIYSLLSEGEVSPIPAFWLYLDALKISDRCRNEGITTEFFISVFKLWKDMVVDSGIKYRMLLSMIKTATELRDISSEAYGSITSELCASAGSLLQKDQQAEAHLLCSHMFNVDREMQEEEQEGEEEETEKTFKSHTKVKNCLVRALKATASMMEHMEQLPWYYRVLGHAIYYLEKGVEIDLSWFNALTAKIDSEHEENAKEMEAKMTREMKQFYLNLIKHKDEVIHIE